MLRRLRIGYDVAGVDKLTAAIGTLEPDPARVVVAIETAQGLLVSALLDAGYTVYAINPKSVEPTARAHASRGRRPTRPTCSPGSCSAIGSGTARSASPRPSGRRSARSPAMTSAPPATSGGC